MKEDPEPRPREGRLAHDALLEAEREIDDAAPIRAAGAAPAGAKRALVVHAGAYLLVGAASVALGERTASGPWYRWVLLAWGALVAAHAARVLVLARRSR